VYKRHPQLILKFGGHAMAAGLTIAEARFDEFAAAFESVARQLLDSNTLTRTLETDGPLSGRELSLAVAETLAAEVWGQGFAAPTFHDDFHIVSQRVVGDKHLKLRLEKDGVQCDGMLFNQVEWLPPTINAVYQLAANEWQGRKELQIYIQHWRQPG